MKLPCGCCLSSPGYIITTGKKKQRSSLSEHRNLLCTLIAAIQTGAQWQVPCCPHFLLFLLGFSPQSHKRGCLFFFFFIILYSIACCLSVPVNNQFSYGLQKAEWPATMITACCFFRYLFFKAAVTAQTKGTFCCHEPKGCISFWNSKEDVGRGSIDNT